MDDESAATDDLIGAVPLSTSAAAYCMVLSIARG
jgi:hypothetical protein